MALEFCVTHDDDMSVTGTIRVANISFHKNVSVRYTLDKWKTTQPEVSLTSVITLVILYAFLVYFKNK